MKSMAAKSSRALIVMEWIDIHEINACQLSRVDETRLTPPRHMQKEILSGTQSHTEKNKWNQRV